MGCLDSLLWAEKLGQISDYFVHPDEQKVHCDHAADGLAAQRSKKIFIKSICHVFSFRQSLHFLQIHTVHICQSTDLDVTQPLVSAN